MGSEKMLDFGRIHIFGPADVHVFLAVNHVEVALPVTHDDVAGVQPAVFDGRRRGFGIIPVALHADRTAQNQLTARAGGYIATFIVYHTGINVEVGESDGADFFRTASSSFRENTFGPNSVRPYPCLTGTPFSCQALIRGRGMGSPPHHGIAQFVEAGIGKGRTPVHHVHHGWNAEQNAHPVFIAKLQHPIGIEFRNHDQPRSPMDEGRGEHIPATRVKKMGQIPG